MNPGTVAASALGFAAHAAAWDPGGHMLVGQIAWELSTPSVRRVVDAMVAVLDSRFNDGRPYHFVTAGCWMDDLRSLPHKEYPWSAWHYVDAAKSEDGSAFKLPEPPHVVWAVSEGIRMLRNPEAPAEERARALGMLIHWVGDIHQPLHATTWNDRGGNGYLITGVPFSDLLPGQGKNLHTFWDKAFRFDGKDGVVVELWRSPVVAERPSSPGKGVIADEAARLMRRFPVRSLHELDGKMDAEDWARESHILGCTAAYPAGPHPGDAEVRKLDADFGHASHEAACRRVVLAGHRLARLLAELLPVE